MTLKDLENIEFQFDLYPSKNLNDTDKIIWSYWNNNMPLSVKIAIYTWKKHNSDYIICVLSDQTIDNYINISEFPNNYNNLCFANKSDLIRLVLLEKYGGIWLDASVYINKPLSFLWDNNYDVGGYYADYFMTNNDYPPLESWFISVPKNSNLIKKWKNELIKFIESNNYKDTILNFEKTIDLQNVGKTDKVTIEGKIYLMNCCCFLKTIQENKYNIKVFSAGNGPFEYLVKNVWNIPNAIDYLLKNTSDDIPDIIKLRGCDRYVLEKSWDKIEENSIISKLLI